MKKLDWEQDIINRQRNIVFPDTVLNEGRFYRNLWEGKAPLNTVQRIGVVLSSLPFILLGAVWGVLALRGVRNSGAAWVILLPVAILGFAIVAYALVFVFRALSAPRISSYSRRYRRR